MIEYIVTTDGAVFSTNYNRTGQTKQLSPFIQSGYYAVQLNGKRYLIHRLVAEQYIPNPNNLPCVNHKDGNKLNNDVNNLEWCSYSENNEHALKNGLRKPRELTSEEAKRMRANVDNSWNYKKVLDITTGKIYQKIQDVSVDGFSPSQVGKVCRGEHKTHKHHVFKFI